MAKRKTSTKKLIRKDSKRPTKRISKSGGDDGTTTSTKLSKCKTRVRSKNNLRKVIIDTDPGSDDAVAMLMLLENKDIQVLAITVTFGNTSIQNTSRNAMRILNAAKRNDVPVYAGAEYSLIHVDVHSDEFYGEDGMGDIKTEYDQPLDYLREEKASPALVRLVGEHPGEITLVGIGPLTNIALAQRIDASFCSKLKECFIMGGNYTGRGIITLAAEFNFYLDPEAASIVMKDLLCPITLIPWELCLSLTLTWEWYKKVTSKNTKYSKFLKAIGGKMVEHSMTRKEKYFVPADELAAACLIDDDIITDSQEMYCKIELAGNLTRGQVVIDWRNEGCQKRKIKIVKSINQQIFKSMIENLVS